MTRTNTRKKRASAPFQGSSLRWFFAFFVLSGFSGLVYQVVWLRIAMAAFGVTTPLVSIVLAVFMGGLAVGSWAAGRLTSRLQDHPADSFLKLYALTELLIGVSGIAVAPLLHWGREILTASGGQAWDSGSYYLASAVCITAALLPFCICMGATFPLAMAAIRAAVPDASPRSFSYLYVANVVGAMFGALSAAFVLIETLGLQSTLLVAAAANVAVACAAFAFARRVSRAVPPDARKRPAPAPVLEAPRPSALGLAFLFTTGIVSLALEVVWTRQFVPFQGPLVYAFATTLAVYLAATAGGSLIYRSRAAKARAAAGGFPWAAAGFLAGSAGLITLLAADPRLPLANGLVPGSVRVLLGIAPFCGVLGYFTAMMVDRISAGDPNRAGAAYAVNTLGCIIGPLVAGFVLLPRVGERWTTLILVVPLFAFAVADRSRVFAGTTLRIAAGSAAAAALLLTFTKDFETVLPQRVVLRDHTATVIAAGSGMNKTLLVNGQGITLLTPITKMMVHLPMAHLSRPPEKGLVLCLGMGTSFRSMLSWGIPTTVVELVPSIPSLLGFFHPDGEAVRQHPLGRIVLDDARRFLDRSAETYDVIVVDPPPPVEAAASSLLYSSEFYESASRRLQPHGILQQWIPYGEDVVISAAARALASRFAHVRVFGSGEGWGLHFLASASPIPNETAASLASRLPASATRDLIEWGPTFSGETQLRRVTQTEMSLRTVLALEPNAPVLSDDRPVNEYYFLRRLANPTQTQ